LCFTYVNNKTRSSLSSQPNQGRPRYIQAPCSEGSRALTGSNAHMHGGHMTAEVPGDQVDRAASCARWVEQQPVERKEHEGDE